MRYQNIHKATFLSRPNRFLAKALLDGEELTVHVKNTGRCKELLVPGYSVYLEKSANPARKTAFDLVAVEKTVGRDDSFAHAPLSGKAAKGRLAGAPTRLVNMDSQAPNKLFEEWARGGHFVPGLTLLRPETTWGHSRFDFYWEAEERKGFVEVKGCTLEEDGWTYFPDAPTERGVKHLEELLLAKQQGYEAAVCFVIQMSGVDGFSPNDRTHPEFGAALRKAAAGGVEVLAYQCCVIPGEVYITTKVPVKL